MPRASHGRQSIAALLGGLLLLTAATTAPAGGADLAEATRLLARARQAAGPPHLPGAILEVSYSIARHDRDGRVTPMGAHRRLLASDGRVHVAVGSASQHGVRASDGESLWIQPVRGDRDGVLGVVAEALDLTRQLGLVDPGQSPKIKRARERGRAVFRFKLEGGRMLHLDAETGDLLETRRSGHLAPSSVAYSGWRSVGQARMPGVVMVTWGDSVAVATLEEARLLLGADAQALAAPDGSEAGLMPQACESWTAPRLQPHARLDDVLWDHATKASRGGGPISRGPGDYGYALTNLNDGHTRSDGDPTSGGSGSSAGRVVQEKFERDDASTKTSARQRSRARGRQTASGSSSATSDGSAYEPPVRKRPRSARLNSAWRVLVHVAADGGVGSTSVVRGPRLGQAAPIRSLDRFLAFEPAQCDGRPVASWHELELTWPLQD